MTIAFGKALERFRQNTIFRQLILAFTMMISCIVSASEKSYIEPPTNISAKGEQWLVNSRIMHSPNSKITNLVINTLVSIHLSWEKGKYHNVAKQMSSAQLKVSSSEGGPYKVYNTFSKDNFRDTDSIRPGDTKRRYYWLKNKGITKANKVIESPYSQAVWVEYTADKDGNVTFKYSKPASTGCSRCRHTCCCQQNPFIMNRENEENNESETTETAENSDYTDYTDNEPVVDVTVPEEITPITMQEAGTFVTSIYILTTYAHQIPDVKYTFTALPDLSTLKNGWNYNKVNGKKEGYQYYRDGDLVLIQYYRNGVKRSTASYRRGKPDGHFYNFDETGKKHGKQYYFSSTGYQNVETYSHGEKIKSGTYKNGKPSGWFYNFNKRKKHGRQIYIGSGSYWSVEEYRFGIKDGIFASYKGELRHGWYYLYENGQQVSKTYYQNGSSQ